MDRDHGEDIANALKAIADAVTAEDLPDLSGLRDRFAACALTGYLAAFAGAGIAFPDPRKVSEASYAYADAMLAERLRRKGAEGV